MGELITEEASEEVFSHPYYTCAPKQVLKDARHYGPSALRPRLLRQAAQGETGLEA